MCSPVRCLKPCSHRQASCVAKLHAEPKIKHFSVPRQGVIISYEVLSAAYISIHLGPLTSLVDAMTTLCEAVENRKNMPLQGKLQRDGSARYLQGLVVWQSHQRHLSTRPGEIWSVQADFSILCFHHLFFNIYMVKNNVRDGGGTFFRFARKSLSSLTQSRAQKRNVYECGI